MAKNAAARFQQPPRPRTCQEFLAEWQPKVRKSGEPIEIDFSWTDDAITITDMRVPSALRTGVLYRHHEVETAEDAKPGDFDRRVDAFMAKGLKA